MKQVTYLPASVEQKQHGGQGIWTGKTTLPHSFITTQKKVLRDSSRFAQPCWSKIGALKEGDETMRYRRC
jgi:hypothetical protein